MELRVHTQVLLVTTSVCSVTVLEKNAKNPVTLLAGLCASTCQGRGGDDSSGYESLSEEIC